jgi:hypothetical protein
MRVFLLAGCFAAAAFLAGCGGGPQSGAALSPSALPLSPSKGQRDVALTVPHYVQQPMHPDHSRSSMSPNAKSSKALLYVGDDKTDDVYVYDYKSGKSVGTLTGFDGPYGECVDAKGDVYVANYGNGTVSEYAHGGTTAINTYSPGGSPIGCAVDAKGDVAATDFDPGDVTVYAKGNPKDGTTYSDSSCEYLWTMGYDDKGNLVGNAIESSGDGVCAVLAGSKTMTTLSTSGFTIDFAGGTTWDGKYFALGDQETGSGFQSGIVRATLKGTTLTYVSETTLSDDCYNDYVDVVNPFIVGKTNTLFDHKQGNALVSPNLWCVDAGTGKVDYWRYPAGGLPYTDLSSGPPDPYGAAVSFAK